jgi:dTDP-4-dehydrorhamnose 3,5-epimerase
MRKPMPFNFKPLPLPGLILVEPKVFPDPRGSFLEIYKESDFKENGIPLPFVQNSISNSTYKTLRGLHYQLPPFQQGKLVKVLKGKVWDVVVDIRDKSPTFKQWYGIELSEEKEELFYIPPGFAHGFIVLSNEAQFLYHLTEEYNPQSERGILWNDPELGIDWRIKDPILSEKDMKNPQLSESELFNGWGKE